MVSEESLLGVLCDDYTVAILEATATAKTVPEISDDTGVPPATCYRRVNELEDAGLLEEHDVVVSSNKRTSQYMRCIDSVDISFDDETATVTVSDTDTDVESEKHSILNKYN